MDAADRSSPSIDHDKLWAKVFAHGARNGVEDLHVDGVFDDAEAPTLNRLLRSRIYEALLALRHWNPDDSDDPFFLYLCEIVDDWDLDDPYRAVLPGAVRRAVEEFGAAVALDEPVQEQLERAAVSGLLEHVELHARAGEPRTQELLRWAIAMVPEYWEEPEPGSEFRSLLDRRTS